MNNLIKYMANLNLSTNSTPSKGDFEKIVEQIYKSNVVAHEIDSKYLKFFKILQFPFSKSIKQRLLTVQRGYQSYFTITCFVSSKNIFISNGAVMDGQCQGFFKNLVPALEIPIKFAPIPVRSLPNTMVVITALTKFSHEKFPYSIKNDPGLAIALGLIESIFDGFWTKYEQYLEAPDDGITVIDNICGINGSFGQSYIPGFIEPNKTKDEKKFMAFMIIMSMFKPIPKIDDAVNARKKRYDVIRAILGSLPLNQDDRFFNIISMQHLAKYFDKLPKLKSLVLSCAVELIRTSKCEPIHNYLLKILIQPEMALFIIIDEFVSMPVKTKAHSHWNIVKEIHCFLHVKRELMNKFADNLYFAKVLEPTTDINVAKWPHLGAVAMMDANVKYPKTNNLKIYGLTYEMDFPELLMNKVKPSSGKVVDCAASRNSDLFLRAIYGVKDPCKSEIRYGRKHQK